MDRYDELRTNRYYINKMYEQNRELRTFRFMRKQWVF